MFHLVGKDRAEKGKIPAEQHLTSALPSEERLAQKVFLGG